MQLYPLCAVTLSHALLSCCFRLTAIEEELLSIAASLGTQQATVNQLEMDLEAEESLDNSGQRWAFTAKLCEFKERFTHLRENNTLAVSQRNSLCLKRFEVPLPHSKEYFHEY